MARPPILWEQGWLQAEFWGYAAAAPGAVLTSPNPSSSPVVAAAMKERRAPQPVVARCKLVLVGDVQCGKTAMLQVLAKDCYPEVSCYVSLLASFSPP